MATHARAKELLVSNAKQTQQKISQVVDSHLDSYPSSNLEQVQRITTIRVLASALERLLVTTEDESDKEHEAFRELEQEASERIQKIFANHERLGLILAEYGQRITKRWKKRRMDQRKKLLLEAWPDMSPIHRPDFEALRGQRSLLPVERRRDGAKHRDAYLFPHVNLEDLSDIKNLLLFIESRACNDPEAFAWSDSQHIRMAADAGAVKIINGEGYTMMLSGQKTRETYGQIVSWNSDLRSIQDVLTGQGFNIGEGLLVLEIQDRTLQFLVRCTERLLADQAIQTVATSVLAQSAPSVGNEHIFGNEISSSERPAEVQSMVEVNTEATYRLPQHQFSLEYLRKLASAQRDEAEDEIWALREDPSYFQDVSKGRYDMLLYVLQSRNERRPTKVEKDRSIDVACRTTIHNPYKYLIIWDIILMDLQKLETLHTGTATSSIQPLPERYQDALASLVLAMDQLAKYPLKDLRKILPMSGPIRQYFDATPQDDGLIIYRLRKDMSIPPILEMIYDLMQHERTATMGLPNILDVIEQIMGQDTAQKNLVTSEVLKALSEMAAIGEIHTRLSRHQPRIQLPMDLDSTIAKVNSRIEIIDTTKENLETATLGTFVTPFSEFKYPLSRKTQKSVDKIRAEEAKLDTFWLEVDQHFTRTTGQTLNDLMADRITAREIGRTPPWQPPVVRPKQKKGVSLQPTAEEIEALRTFQTDAESSSTPLATQPKEKIKTRGVAEPPLEPALAEEPPGVEEPPAQTFTLAKAPYKTMRAFFPEDVQDRIAGKVLWKDFVSAMQKLDFSIRSRVGSASQFEPAWKPESTVIFHEPHPGNEIRFDLLRVFAGKLSRKYGWTAETFVQG